MPKNNINPYCNAIEGNYVSRTSTGFQNGDSRENAIECYCSHNLEQKSYCNPTSIFKP